MSAADPRKMSPGRRSGALRPASEASRRHFLAGGRVRSARVKCRYRAANAWIGGGCAYASARRHAARVTPRRSRPGRANHPRRRPLRRRAGRCRRGPRGRGPLRAPRALADRFWAKNPGVARSPVESHHSSGGYGPAANLPILRSRPFSPFRRTGLGASRRGDTPSGPALAVLQVGTCTRRRTRRSRAPGPGHTLGEESRQLLRLIAGNRRHQSRGVRDHDEHHPELRA